MLVISSATVLNQVTVNGTTRYYMLSRAEEQRQNEGISEDLERQ